jgi:hypothetical protein
VKKNLYICGHCGSLNHHSCGSDICECAAQGHVPSIELARRMAGGLVLNPSDREAIEVVAKQIVNSAKEDGFEHRNSRTRIEEEPEVDEVPAQIDEVSDDSESCDTCTEDPTHETYPLNECPESKRPCGHHCNHSWTHDRCDWCGTEFGEDEE